MNFFDAIVVFFEKILLPRWMAPEWMHPVEVVGFYITLVIGLLFTVCYTYQFLYVFLALVHPPKKYKDAPKTKRYAAIIAARNEDTVIGNLLESIAVQDYHTVAPNMIDVFVVADNCTDNTEKVALSHGAKCYCRHDDKNRTKGFALQFLIENIRKDYGIEHYDGYIVFDADNLLSPDYISRMNDAFDDGNKIICSYRNTKNFKTNWISASYALHYLRTIRTEHRARSYLRMATRIQGTGFLVANEIIKDGWKYTSLTEDRARSADAVVMGYDITYNNDAVFYDEQPTTLHSAMRQRIRWAKGNIQAFTESGGKLFLGIFKSKGIHLKLRNFDMLMTIFPRQLVTGFRRVIILFTKAITFLLAADWLGIAPALIFWFFTPFVKQWCYALYALIFERKRIVKIPLYRIMWFVFMFPFFDVIGRIAMLIALFSHVEWKPIPHKEDIRLSDMQLDNTNKAPAKPI